MTIDSPQTGRTDPEIFIDARHALDDNPAVPAAVHIHVHSGIITLTGSVRLAAERLEAEETVRRVGGIRGIVNDIFVREVPAAGYEAPDDADRFRR